MTDPKDTAEKIYDALFGDYAYITSETREECVDALTLLMAETGEYEQ